MMRRRQILGALPRRLRPVSVYATVAALTVAMFIALHHMGNQLPFELAVKRLADEFRATPGLDWGMRGGLLHDGYHYCELSAGVVADARAAQAAQNGDGTALRRAIASQTVPGTEHSPNACDDVKAAVLDNVWLEGPAFANLRHWRGGKALYAIALRHWTVRDIYLAINALVHCGFLFLALVLLQIGWRALLVGTPIVAFGLFFAGVERYFNVTDGLPFAWALFAPALVALLLRLGLRMSVARALFFFAGMLSHYLWFFDGGNFLAATLIGLVVWLARAQDSPRRRVFCAATCMGVYAAGFVVSLVSRIVIASITVDDFWEVQVIRYMGPLLGRISTPWPLDLRGRDFGEFQGFARIDAPTAQWLLLTTAVALVAAVLAAGYRARGRRPGALFELLWLMALLLPSGVHFLMPIDDPNRSVRFMFLPLAVSWCCVLAVLTRLSFRPAVVYAGGLGAAAAFVYAGAHFAGQWKYEAKLRNARLLAAARGDDAFALYLFELPEGRRANGTDPGQMAGRELIYWKSRCSDKDLETAEGLEKRFYLHLMADEETLPERGRELGFVNADFSFYTRGQKFFGTCHAFVRLPNYAQRIRTGQVFYDGRSKLWGREIDLTSALDVWALVPDGPPATRAFFDLYLNREHGMLVYSRTPCRGADTAARFFLHVEPLSHDTLPRRRQQYGFDNLDFDFADRGRMMPVGSGRCVAAVKLPGYPLARLRTGQFAEGQLWEARMDFVSASAPER